LLTKETHNKTEERFEDKQEKLKQKKLNQIGIKIMTKLREDKQEKHLKILKETYLNFDYEGLVSLEIVKARRIKFQV